MAVTPHVQSWIDYLAKVEVRGPIPVRFWVVDDPADGWILASAMHVPDSGDAATCGPCGRPLSSLWVTIQNALPGPDDPTPRDQIIRQRVLGHYQHEALESIYIDRRRAFDPHDARWYSNLVVDWRLNR